MFFITQRTNRHVAKRLSTASSPAVIYGQFGVFKVKGSDNSHLSNPWGMANDYSGFVYICDSENQRIVKLNSSMALVSQYDTRSTIGQPCAILYDGGTNNIYVTGIYNNAYIRIERLTSSLASVRVSGNLNAPGTMWFRPTGISRGFATDSLLVAGSNLGLFQTIETTSFSSFTTQNIVGETTTWPKLFTTTAYNAVIKHTNGSVYVNNGQQILRATNTSPTLTNIGDSNLIGSTITGLKEGTYPSGSLLLYMNKEQKVVRYNANMNFLEDIYWTTGSTVALDAYDVADFAEV